MNNDRRRSPDSTGTTHNSATRETTGRPALVKYHQIIARHSLDIGINTEFKVRLQPKHDNPVHAHSLSTPANMNNRILVELAMIQEYDVITTLPYSKHSLSIFEQRKAKDKLRLLVDLKRINPLIKRDYKEHHQPCTTIVDAAHIWPPRKLSVD